MPSTSTPVPEVQHVDGAAPSSEEMVENIELTEEEDAKFQRNLNAVSTADPASQLAGATATNEKTKATSPGQAGASQAPLSSTEFETATIGQGAAINNQINDDIGRAPGSGQPMTTSNFITIVGRRIGFKNVILPANAMVDIIDDTTSDLDMIANQINDDNGRAPGSGQPLTGTNLITMSGPRSGFRNVYIPANAIVNMIADDDDERAPSQGGASSMTITNFRTISSAFESVRIPANALMQSIPNNANSPFKSATLAGGSINHLNNDGKGKNNKKSFDFRMFFNGDKFSKF